MLIHFVCRKPEVDYKSIIKPSKHWDDFRESSEVVSYEVGMKRTVLISIAFKPTPVGESLWLWTGCRGDGTINENGMFRWTHPDAQHAAPQCSMQRVDSPAGPTPGCGQMGRAVLETHTWLEWAVTSIFWFFWRQKDAYSTRMAWTATSVLPTGLDSRVRK